MGGRATAHTGARLAAQGPCPSIQSQQPHEAPKGQAQEALPLATLSTPSGASPPPELRAVPWFSVPKAAGLSRSQTLSAATEEG